VLVALCAVESDPMPDDIYLDDGVDHALRVKFIRDYKSEGIDFGSTAYPEEDALAETQKVRDAKTELENWLKREHGD